MAHDCIKSPAEFQAITDAEKPLQGTGFLERNKTETEPWRGVMMRNTPGQAPAGAPVFIAQGTADTTVRPEITKQFGDHLCSQGTRGQLRRAPRRLAYLRRQAKRARGAGLDRRPFQRRAGAVELPEGLGASS